MKATPAATTQIVKITYFGNWADIWGFPLAYKLLPFIAKISFLTPNVITIGSFLLFIIGSLSLFINYPAHFLITSIALPLAFLGDDLDGQIARHRNLSSELGNYLDKTIDILKIFILTASLGYATFIRTGNSVYLFLGFTAGFFFMFRYYIKLETIFQEIDKDEKYLDKAKKLRDERAQSISERFISLEKSFGGKLYSFWLKNRLIFLVDEAEFVCITAVAAICNQLEIGLWIIAIAQVSIGLWRWIERGYQITTHSPRLLWPMRK